MIRLHTGKPFGASRFQNGIWTAARAKAGVGCRRPYATRHTFVCWSLMAGVHPARFASLMGHNSKQTCGAYTEGLEEDVAWIGGYLLGAEETCDPRDLEGRSGGMGGNGIPNRVPQAKENPRAYWRWGLSQRWRSLRDLNPCRRRERPVS